MGAAHVGGTTVEISVFPTSTQAETLAERGTPKPQCKQQDGLTGCVVVTADAVGSASDVLRHLTLLGTDPANWTPNVIVRWSKAERDEAADAGCRASGVPPSAAPSPFSCSTGPVTGAWFPRFEEAHHRDREAAGRSIAS